MNYASIIICVLSLSLTIASLVLGFLTLTSTTSIYPNSAGAGYIVAPDASGECLYETNITVASLVDFMSEPTLTRANVLSTGPIALNVSLEVARHGPRRSYLLWTHNNGTVVTGSGLMQIDFSDTGVILPSDLPLLAATPTASSTITIPTCSYTLSGSDSIYTCALDVAADGVLTMRPSRTGPGYIQYWDEGLEEFHFNRTLILSAAFSWFVSAAA